MGRISGKSDLVRKEEQKVISAEVAEHKHDR